MKTPDNMEYLRSRKYTSLDIDVPKLRERIKQDGRSIYKIANEAGISPMTFYNALSTGSASEYTIDKIRLELKPWMRKSTICPSVPAGKRKGKIIEQQKATEDTPRIAWITEAQKRYSDIHDEVFDLCLKYSLNEVSDCLYDIQANYIGYMESECGFTLQDVIDESMSGIPEIEERVIGS